MRVLGVGALDGPYAFEMERRGAEVTALDVASPDHTGFNVAKRLRGSSAKYVQGSVYDLPELLPGERFDIILFFGVWYHLRSPVLAFERLADALVDDGRLLFEGECVIHYVEVAEWGPTERLQFAQWVSGSPVPMSIFYPDAYKEEHSNWTVPNTACVQAWVKACGLEWVGHHWFTGGGMQRLFGEARKQPGVRATPESE